MAEHQHRTEYTLEPIWPILHHEIHIVSEYDCRRIHGAEVTDRMLRQAQDENQVLIFNNREWFRYGWYTNFLKGN